MQLGDAGAQQGFVKAVIKTSLTTNPLKLQSLASQPKNVCHVTIFTTTTITPPPPPCSACGFGGKRFEKVTHRDREGVGEREWHGRWKPFRRGVRELAVVEEVSSVEEPKDLPCL